MRLKHDWRAVLRHAWSLRLIGLSLAFDAAEFAVDILADNPPLPRGSFIAIGIAIKIGAGVARLVAQPCLTGDRHEQA